MNNKHYSLNIDFQIEGFRKIHETMKENSTTYDGFSDGGVRQVTYCDPKPVLSRKTGSISYTRIQEAVTHVLKHHPEATNIRIRMSDW